MANLVGIQIRGLQAAPTLSGDTELPLQRIGIDKAEKTNLQNLLNWVLVSPNYVENINNNVGTRVSMHVAGTDPHGDRAYANSLISNHTSGGGDPHGDRAYAVTTVNNAITTHTNASDPHGDRLFTTTSISLHTSASDPHGDRAFATNLNTTTLSSANTYTDNKINSEFTARINTTIAPLVSGKVPNSYINMQVVFDPKTAFPVSGTATNLYVDTTGKDIYYWNGTSYHNLTPDVDIGQLNLTTDTVPEGTNPDRKYLTAAKNTLFSSKLTDVVADTALEGVTIVSKKEDSIVSLKGIKTSYPLSTEESTAEDVIISDNTYVYTSINTADESLLLYNNPLKIDPLETTQLDKIYTIKGDVFVYSPQVVASTTLVAISEKFNVEAMIARVGVTQAVPKVTTGVINATGETITGTGLANSTLEVYNQGYTLLGTTSINALGNFNYTITPADITGKAFHLYVKTPAGERSEKFTVYSPNKDALREPTGLSVKSDGTELYGVAERLVTVTITDHLDAPLGTATADANGFFKVTLSTAVVESDQIKVNSKNSLNTESDLVTYTVKLSPNVAAKNLVVNNKRTSIRGVCAPDGIVHVYKSSALIATLTAGSNGVFAGNLEGLLTTDSILEVEVVTDPTTSPKVEYKIPIYYTEVNEPDVIPLLIDSTFDFIYKSITKTKNLSSFDFNITITNSNEIELRAKNNLTKEAKWKATFKIDLDSI